MFVITKADEEQTYLWKKQANGIHFLIVTSTVSGKQSVALS